MKVTIEMPWVAARWCEIKHAVGDALREWARVCTLTGTWLRSLATKLH